MENILLKVEHVSKSFGPTKALVDVNVEIPKGTIHSFIGKNGAGKSTLVNIIAGVYNADTGKIVFDGKDMRQKTIYDRQQEGIRIVTQQASVIPELTVAENICIGMWPRSKSGMIDWKAIKKQAAEILEEYGIALDPHLPMSELGSVMQRKINIVRSLFGGGKLIILDEPTTSLSSQDRENLFEFVNKLAEKGITFIFISHYLDEVLKLSSEPQNISVIRDGKIIPLASNTERITQTHLAHMLAGEKVELTQRIQPKLEDQVALECKGLTAKNLKNVSCSINKGEVIGLVGFPDSGAQELMRALYGLNKITDGSIELNGKRAMIKKPADAIRQGIVYVSYDRHAEGIVKMHSVRENIGLPVQKRKLRNKIGLISGKKEQALANEMIELFNIKVNNTEDILDSLSGGNQQKVVIAKAISCEPICLMLDEPTIGIDIQSREEILSLVNRMTREGLAVFYLTNDFEELARISDKLFFFKDGVIEKIVQNNDLTATDIVSLRDSNKKERC